MGPLLIDLSYLPIGSKRALNAVRDYVFAQLARNTVAVAVFTAATIATLTATDIALANDMTITDGGNVISGTTTGTKFGTAVTQKFGFWNATPIVQPAHADQGTAAVTAGAALTMGTNITAATANGSLTDSSATNPSDAQFNELAKELGTKVNALIVDVTANNTLLIAVRTALVNAGLMKGAA